MCSEVEASLASAVGQANAIADDIIRTEQDRAYLISMGSDKWMKQNAPSIDKCVAELTDYSGLCETALKATLNESSTTDAVAGAETRTFLRGLNVGHRVQLAESNPKFTAAVAAKPAEMSGVHPKTHAQCIAAYQ